MNRSSPPHPGYGRGNQRSCGSNSRQRRRSRRRRFLRRRPTHGGEAHHRQRSMSGRPTPNHRRVPRDFKGGHQRQVYG